VPDSSATVTPIFDQLVEEFREREDAPAGAGPECDTPEPATTPGSPH
jgi:hypothetical protein